MAPSLLHNVKKLKELWEEDQFGRKHGFWVGSLSHMREMILVVLKLPPNKLETGKKLFTLKIDHESNEWVQQTSSILVPTMHTKFNIGSSHPEKMWDWGSWCRINKVSACVYYPHFFFSGTLNSLNITPKMLNIN